MDALPERSLLIVASLQASISLAALVSSNAASLAAAAIGVLAVGRYAAMGFFARAMGSPDKAALRSFAGLAWVLGLFALIAAVAAVALRFRPILPWAVAAAVAGPLGMSALALLAGIVGLSGSRRAGGHGAVDAAAQGGGNR